MGAGMRRKELKNTELEGAQGYGVRHVRSGSAAIGRALWGELGTSLLRIGSRSRFFFVCVCARIQAGKVREQLAAGKVREHLPAGTVRVQWGDCDMRCIALALACAF